MTNLHRIMSFNLNGTWGENGNRWNARAPLCVNIINRYKPNIIGLQEAMTGNLDTLESQLEQYTFVAGNYYGDTPPDAYTSILYRTDRYDLLSEGEFWFSDTPDVESSGWGVAYPMGATWVKLRCKESGDALVFLNTHFEDGPDGEESRNKASRLIVERLAEIAPGIPVLMTGDFNCNPWWEPYNVFLNDGFKDCYREAGHADSAESSSIHLRKGDDYFSLDYGNEMFWRIDWILAKDGDKRVQPVSCQIVKDANPPTYPSDHYPIVSEVRINSNEL